MNNFCFQAKKRGMVMVNFFSYYLTCTNHSTIHDVVGMNGLFFIKKGFVIFNRFTPFQVT